MKDFWTFCEQREWCREQREQNSNRPWTKDERLDRYWFPNIRRMDDPTTCWLHGAILRRISDPDHLIMATVAFRLFNRLDLGPKLESMLLNYGYDSDILLETLAPHEGFLFNGHLPKPMTGGSLDASVRILNDLLDSEVIRAQLKGTSLQQATEAVSEIKGLRALAYEIVLDLRRTQALRDAPDVRSWACATPAAVNGAGELLGEPLRATRRDDREITLHLMQEILQSKNPLAKGWEMAEVHRALCLYFTWARKARPTRRYRK